MFKLPQSVLWLLLTSLFASPQAAWANMPFNNPVMDKLSQPNTANTDSTRTDTANTDAKTDSSANNNGTIQSDTRETTKTTSSGPQLKTLHRALMPSSSTQDPERENDDVETIEMEATSLPDPTKPPGNYDAIEVVEDDGDEESNTEALRLYQILQGIDGLTAIINGKRLKLNERIGDKELIKISLYGVVLSDGINETEISLFNQKRDDSNNTGNNENTEGDEASAENGEGSTNATE